MSDLEQDYDQEQHRLKVEAGIEDDDDAPIVDTSLPEVNPEIYRDVEPLILRGFLTVPAVVNNQRFVFKSLNQNEYDRISMMHDIRSAEDIQRYYDSFLSYSVLILEEANMLRDRDDSIYGLSKFFATLDKAPKQKIIRYLSEVNKRANRATILTEAFAMENRSRLKWAQLSGLDPCSTAVTGFENTEILGLNWAQMTWRALNHLEDLRENAEREWENTKFIASAMAGKGMNKVYSADKRRRQSEKEERFARREKIIRYALMNIPLDSKTSHGNILVARTVEELSEQLEKSMKGEQDWHDRAIQEHEKRLRDGYNQRSRDLAAIRAQHIEQYGDKAVIAYDAEKGLTREEVMSRIKKRQRETAERLAEAQKFPEVFDERYSEFADKWYRDPTVSPPTVMVPQDKKTTVPFRRTP